MRILVTGGAGFIGSNFIRLLLREKGRNLALLNVDKLTYAGNLENLAEVAGDNRYSFLRGDIADSSAMEGAFKAFKPDIVAHLAAESHVDRSIEDAAPFIRTNVLGTQVLLDCARQQGVKRFLHVSTDEVYGSLRPQEPAFTETTPLAPNSPYAASKAGSDFLALACHHTFNTDVVVTRCSNNYGPYQFPEKLIPLMIRNALVDKPLPIYGRGENIRDWIHVEDHCRALLKILEAGVAGKVYNIGGNSERRNIDLVLEILRILGKPESLIRFVADRPGHDFRYAMDTTFIRSNLGWKAGIPLEKGLEMTVRWYQENSKWVEEVVSGEYLTYYDRMYSGRITEGKSR